MTRQALGKRARKLRKEGNRGWLTPSGDFFESDETPAVRITGLSLGGHEQAALQWLESEAPDLLDLLEIRRVQGGYECWIDTDGTDMIKSFMFEHGFLRVAPE
jgi:hypothetical protein